MTASSSPDRRPFELSEYEDRIARTRARMRERGLDALLLFAQESDYYLTGYDTGGFVFFQCVVLTADSTPLTLLTRRPDEVQARDTSIIDDIRVWWNAEDANPARELKGILAEKHLKGARIGIELNTHGLTGYNHELVRRELEGWCTLLDASSIVRELRLCKSPAELAYVRKAAELCAASLEAVIAAARPGIRDTALQAVSLKTVLEGGGDLPPTGIFNSGRRALYGRSVAGGRILEPVDQVLLEYPVAYRRYNAKTEWMIILGPLDPVQRTMYEVTREALDRMTEVTRPGRTIGDIFEEHRRTLDDAGYAKHRYGACGYSLGATYGPTTMDVPPMIYPGNPTPIQPGMTLFFHVMVTDTSTGFAMGVGHTVVATEGTPEVLIPLPDELTVIR